MGRIIGIDLGTSNSAAAVLDGTKPKIVPSAEGASQYGKSFPSYVSFMKDNSMLVGDPAKRQMVSNPDGTVYAVKRKIGTNEKINIRGKEYTPQEISAFILQKIKKDAQDFLGEKIEKAVITVPAYFNDNQRQATKDAGEIAGLEVVRLVNEPTAACLAYGLDKKTADEKILVYDLGGGTLDVTIMEFGEGVFEVLSTSGDTKLGGTDMDDVVIEMLVSEFKKQSGVDITKDKSAMQRLKEAAEKAKIELSTVLNTEINLPYLSANQDGPMHFTYTLSRAKLEDLVKPIIEKSKESVKQALKDAKLSENEITKIILVGGPTRMPIVQNFVKELIGREPERGVDPMEAVAMGAAVQAGVLSGDIKDIVLLDVVPLTLGIETLGGIMTKLIDRNTTIPAKKSQVFSTAADNQTSVDIHIIQGEREMAHDNSSLGKFTLMGIPPAPRGFPQIEVTFDIDANGILNVSATDKATGKKQSIRITAPNKMDKKDIEEKIKEAEKYAEDDKKRKENIEIKNNAESSIYTAEKTISDLKDKLSEEEKKKLTDAKEELSKIINSEDYEKIKEKDQELIKIMQEVGKKMYENIQKENIQQEKNENVQQEKGEYKTDAKEETNTNEEKKD